MKKAILFVATLLATLSLSQSLNAQKKTELPTNKYKQTVFAELGTPGLGVSFNYDTRFIKGKNNGIGGQIGLGIFITESNLMASLPLGVNYLMGKRRSFFEVGAVFTPFLFTRGYYDNAKAEYTTKYSFGFNFSPTFAWRYQPENEGFFFGAGISPLVSFNKEAMGNLPIGGFVRLGYTF